MNDIQRGFFSAVRCGFAARLGATTGTTNRASLTAMIMAAAFTLTSGQAAAADVADRVLRGGKVYTLNSEAPWAEAVAIHGDRIVYVGDDTGVAAFTGPATDVVELGGRLVLPGLDRKSTRLNSSHYS